MTFLNWAMNGVGMSPGYGRPQECAQRLPTHAGRYHDCDRSYGCGNILILTLDKELQYCDLCEEYRVYFSHGYPANHSLVEDPFEDFYPLDLAAW